MSPTPEQKARQNIDRQLEKSGWMLQDYKEMDLSASPYLAVREFPLETGHVDYLLYADGKAIGTVEAKSEGQGLKGVEEQSDKYVKGFPTKLPSWRSPLPFAYESTGVETQFTDLLDPEPRSRDIFSFFRPDELVRLAQLDNQLRANLKVMPSLEIGHLWEKQITAIQNLEKSLAQNKPRALIQMATGSGKTFTACNIAYRLIKFAKAKRILFLVDRNNLGRQTLNEFQQFQSPYNNYKFVEEYNVQHLKKNTIAPSSHLVITTIQRLYSILKGEEEYDEANEEDSLFETAPRLFKEPLPVVYNTKIPPEFFDFIIVDECHRSIYNLWRQVLEYFDTFLIGLTATPSAQTIGFFKQNLVMEYPHEQAVVDGVNVGYDVYRIETQISGRGSKLSKQPGFFVPRRDRMTRQKRLAELDNDIIYESSQLDRDVINESQIRLVVQTFRDKLFTEIFPGRTEVPKTLVFAKLDSHAEDITRIIREEFGKGNEFCQKITSKTTGRDPNELLNEFRNSYFPRIVVTVDMIATGTDVKPLECLLFMRNINSASYFEQMKGRGVRVINEDDLQSVTPDTRVKDRFVVVDAVGVTESEKSFSKPLDCQPTVTLQAILKTAAAGGASADLVSTLASRLVRLNHKLNDEQRKQISKEAGGLSLKELADRLLKSIDPDLVSKRAVEKFNLFPGHEPEEKLLVQAEQETMKEALKPFFNPKLRQAIEKAQTDSEQILDEVNQDKLIQAGFDGAAKEKAESLVRDFKKFIEEHKQEIEAIQVLYSRPYRLGLRYGQVKDLAQQLGGSPFFINSQQPQTVQRLWQAYETVEPQKVKGKAKQLVDLIALVRHAIQPETILEPVESIVESRYRVWLDEKQKAGMVFTDEQCHWLDTIKDHISSSLSIGMEDLEEVPFKQFGGLGKAHQVFGNNLLALLNELNLRLVA